MTDKKLVKTNNNKTLHSMNEDGYVDIAKKLGTKTAGNSGFSLTLADDTLFAALYVGNGLTRRFIDLLADDMTRQWVTIPEDTEGKALNYMKNLRVKFEIKKALRAAKLFGGSIIFMVIEDGLEPDEPVNINNIKSIKKLKFFSRKHVVIDQQNYYTDPTSEKFGDPEYFTIYSEGGMPVTVHESRCLVFQGEYYPCDELGLQPNYEKYWGLSTLQALHEIFENYGLALEALLKVFQKFNIDTLKIKNLMQLLSSPDGQKQLEARAQIFDLAKSVSTTLVLDSEESFEVIAQSLTGAADAFTKIQETVAAMTGVPSNILMGTAIKGLNANGNGEMRIYYDKIRSDQEEELIPQLEYLVELISYSKDAKLTFEQEYNVIPNSLWQQTDEEKVEMRRKQAETDQIYITNGVYDPNEVRESRFGNSNYSIETEIEGEVDLGSFNDNNENNNQNNEEDEPTDI
jgi:phage-related protein (TIGR01555 family)